ncbi:MAG: LPS export ABC transporter periplasmic protein LptC [Burkholderiales bacterium]
MSGDRLLAWTPIVLLAALAALTNWLDRSVQSEGTLILRDPSNPDIIVEDFSATKFNLDGSQRYALVAHRMVHRPDEDSTQLENPKLTHYEPGEPQVHIQSNHAYVSKDAKEVDFTGDVRILSEGDEQTGPVTVTTSQLHVMPDEEIARSDQEVTISSQHGTLRGVGLEFNSRTRNMQLHSRVRGQLTHPRVVQK